MRLFLSLAASSLALSACIVAWESGPRASGSDQDDAGSSPADATSADVLDAGDDGDDGGERPPGGPRTVLSTADPVVDVAVSKDTLYLLLASPSRIESCPVTDCTARTVRIPPVNMPKEVQAAGGSTAFHVNRRLLVLPLGAGDGFLVAQDGNAPCSVDCDKAPPMDPAIYGVAGDRPPDRVYVMVPPGFFKGGNVATVKATRGATIVYENVRNNESPSTATQVAIRFAPNAGKTGFDDVTVRDDTRSAPMVYKGVSLAAAHGDGNLYITRSGSPTRLFAANLASHSDNGSDTFVGVEDAVSVVTTGSLRFAITSSGKSSLLVRGKKGGAINEPVALAGFTSAHQLVGTDLGLLWFLPKAGSDGEPTSSPLEATFCPDAELAALASGATCTGTKIAIDLDEVQSVKEDGPYLYAFGTREGKASVVAFEP